MLFSLPLNNPLISAQAYSFSGIGTNVNNLFQMSQHTQKNHEEQEVIIRQHSPFLLF
jgi:tRNA A37 threonylcarbamoyltransferase TsaD